VKVHWTAEARAELTAIETYLAEHSQPAARRTIRRITARAGQIGALPYSGRMLPEFGRDDLHEVLVRPYRIIYRILPARIDIVTVWHCRRLLPHHIA